MEYTLIEKKPGVRAFIVAENGLLLEASNDKIYHDDILIRSNESSNVDFTSMSGKIFIVEGGKTYVYNEDKLLVEHPLPLVLGSVQDNKAIFTYEKDIKKRLFKRAYYSLDTFQKLSELPAYNTLGMAYFLRDGLIFYNKTLNILSYINVSGDVLWKHDVNQYSRSPNQSVEVLQNIGVYCNTLWVHLSSSGLLGLDVNTGMTVRYLPMIYQSLGLVDASSQAMLNVKQMHLDVVQGKIKSLAHRYYFEIDLNTFKSGIRTDFGENGNISWRITQSTLSGKYLYFIGAAQGEPVNRAIGVFDTDTATIVWYEQDALAEKKYLFYTTPPLVANLRMFVLDSEGNLHVYGSR